MDFEGLQQTAARLIAGDSIRINIDFFQNDFVSFESADDVLTLLVHLGYLVYHESDGTVTIPNEEIRIEFRQLKNMLLVGINYDEKTGRHSCLIEKA